MPEVRFNVVVSGAPLDGFDLQQVKIEFAKLFSLVEARVEKIFHRGNVTIKKGVDEVTAHKFIRALERIGAAAHLQSYHEDTKPVLKEPAPVEPKESSTSSVKTATDAGNTDTSNDGVNKIAADAQPQSKESNKNPTSGTGDYRLEEATASPEKPAEADIQSQSDGCEPFRFHGNGSEYFRIWIVNILLTIATLGIYSAWAKVRNAQYFHGHTELAGSRFSYHAKPLTILKGRIIAVLFFVIYITVSELFPIAGAAMAILLLLLLPWIAIRSLRFNRRMTGWRQIRFGFNGELWPAVQCFTLWPLAAAFTAGLLAPVALYKQQQFIIDNSRFGTAPFQLNPCSRDFFMIYVMALVIMVVAGLSAWLVSTFVPPLTPVVFAVTYLYLFVFLSVKTTNLIYDNSQLRGEDFGFSSGWSQGSYFKLVLVNSLLTLLTLGFFMPWAMVRVAQYKAERLVMLTNTDLEGFVAGEEQHVTALGEEIGDVFDMEVGL
ncbi:MAG: YjgN family protein [Motiliproteus sp.]